jgi:hypothetical protein
MRFIGKSRSPIGTSLEHLEDEAVTVSLARTIFAVIACSTALAANAHLSGVHGGEMERDRSVIISEKDRRAPADYGFGPGVRPGRGVATRAMAAPADGIPNGGPLAHRQGVFGPPITWPIIGLHAVLLPDGRVMTYGTDELGQQGAQLIYDVWDPALGTDATSHLTLPNGTGTDIFCSAQTLLATGEVFIAGGDRTINGERNHSDQQTTIFNPRNNTLRPYGAMAFPRWYPTMVTLPNEDVVILGGRQDPHIDAPTPEVFNPRTGWRTLTGATSVSAYGFPDGNWYYPRAFVAPSGRIFVLGNWVETYSLATVGAGTITRLPSQVLPGDYQLPSVMFAPGRVLSLRANRKVNVVDLRPATPIVTTAADIDQVRYWSNMTVLADGKVLVDGGSAVANELQGVAYRTQIWTPATGAWTAGADASKPRLYHSISLLLPDASVLTAAGGAPGPVNNLNAEIYYPAYLYRRDGSGRPAIRPSLLSAPLTARIGQSFIATVGANETINGVTLIRAGSVTHSFNPDQRFLRVPFTQSGNQLTITLPGNRNVALPGYYMLFVLRNGVPSVAKIVRVVV